MVALQIRDVPDDVRQAIADAASSRGQSLQSYLLKLITDDAARSRNTDLLRGFARRRDGSALTADELTDAVDQARSERDRSIGE